MNSQSPERLVAAHTKVHSPDAGDLYVPWVHLVSICTLFVYLSSSWDLSIMISCHLFASVSPFAILKLSAFENA